MEEPEEFAVDNSEPSNTTNEENTEKSQQGWLLCIYLFSHNKNNILRVFFTLYS